MITFLEVELKSSVYLMIPDERQNEKKCIYKWSILASDIVN